MLYAAIFAIGAHYSNDDYNANKLHDLCVKLLAKVIYPLCLTRSRANQTQRDELSMIVCDRLCDYQAIFLIEVFAHNLARRCSREFSLRWYVMYEKVLSTRPFRYLSIADIAEAGRHAQF